MFPQTHLIISLVICIILFPFFGFNVFIIFLASILIDFDHYTSFAFQNKSRKDNWSLKKAFKWHATRQWEKDKIMPFVFLHFIEVPLILFFLSFGFNFFFYILIGFLIHLPFDIIKEIRLRKFRLEKYSFIYYLLKAYS